MNMKKQEKILKKVNPQSIKKIAKELKWIHSYSLHYKGEVLWYMFLGLLGTVIGLAGGILSKYIIDAVTDYSPDGIFIALLFFVLMQLSKIGINAVSGYVSAKINIRVNQQISAEVYDKLMQSDWEALSAYHSGDLISRVVGDVNTISSSVLGWIPNLITRSVQFFATLGVILYYDSSLAFLALLSAPITLIMSRFVVRKMRDHSERIRQLNSDMIIFNEESFQNIQVIKGFDLAEQFSKKHREIQEKHKKYSLEYTDFTIRKNTVMSVVGTVVALVCFAWGIYRLKSGFITYGTMTLFLQLATNLSDSFTSLAGMVPQAINASTAAGRIMDITQLPKEERGNTDEVSSFAEKSGGKELTVRAEKISYAYDDGREVLLSADFEAKAGQIVAFIGPSGEGKTTILRLLLGIIKPDSGNLYITDNNLNKVKVSASTRGLFSYVPQGNTLFSGTVAENLRAVKSDATDGEIIEALKTACADKFILELPLGINTPLKELGGGFSQGQIQRICIARALLADKPILLLDEATSALDIKTEQKVLENIMASKNIRTCIITTHRLSVIEISDRIYNVNKEKVEHIEKEQID